jgi:phage tail-like protein
MAQPAQRRDPFGNFNFLVEIDGIARAAFQEVSGGDVTTDVTEYREGGENTTVRKLPGITKHGNLTLKWGVNVDLEIVNWFQASVAGDVQRKSGSIVLLDRAGVEVARWNFKNAWAVKYDTPDFKAESSTVGIESVELAHEALERVK